jgi:Mn-dependent DtxR family transcriptional regulator
MHELTGPNITLIQDELAAMIGVRRSRVTTIAIGLQQAGIISYKRGRIQIDDVAKLEARACGCATELRSYRRLLFNGE